MDRRIGGWMAALAVAALMGFAAPGARAGTYDVYACTTPSGTFTNHSWMLAVNGPPHFVTTSCAATGQGLSLRSDADQVVAAGSNATMTFSPPAGAVIADFRLHRYLQQFN